MQLQQTTAPHRTASPGTSIPGGSSMRELVHDARSVVTALGLYCDLLSEPGVLAAPHRHFLDELRLLSAAARSLVEKLGVLSDWKDVTATPPGRLPRHRSAHEDGLPPVSIANFAAELRASRNLLEAMAGPGLTIALRIDGGELPVRLTGEELIRVLVNLVKNAAEAVPPPARVEIRLRERRKPEPHLLLTVEDNGPGIPATLRETVFAPRFTTKGQQSANPSWSATHRGLGLSITRSILEAAGGRITAAESPAGGARLEIELPVRRP